MKKYAMLCLKSFLTAIVLAGLSGCALLDPGPPPAQVIMPIQQKVARESNRMPASILVDHPIADGAAGSDRILALLNGYEVRALDRAKWVSPVPWMVQRLIIDALEASRRLESVGWEESVSDATIKLQTDIRRFFLRYDAVDKPPVADLTIIFSLVDMQTSRTFGRTVVSVEQQCQGNSVAEFVAAYTLGMTKVLNQSSEWVLRSIEEHLGQTVKAAKEAPPEGRKRVS